MTTYVSWNDIAEGGLTSEDTILLSGSKLSTMEALATYVNAIPPQSGAWDVSQLPDASAPNSSLYYSTDNNTLTFKDPSGVLYSIELALIPQ